MTHNPPLIMTIARQRTKEKNHEVQIVALRMTSDFKVGKRKDYANFLSRFATCLNSWRKT